MFEQPVGKAEKERSRIIIVASGLAILAVIILIVLFSWLGAKKQQAIDLSFEGSTEFSSYAQFVTVEVLERKTGERFNKSQYKRMVCLLQNTGDKTLTAVQLRGAAIRYTGETTDNFEVVKEKLVTPVPSDRDSLAAKQSMRVEIFFEPLDENTVIDDLIVQVKGLKVK
jgi:5-deoxy-D-glucuronate isomerase